MAINTVQIPEDPRDWRPQVVDNSKGSFLVENAIAEPVWSGTRVLVFFHEAENRDEWGTVDVIDEQGNDALASASRAFDQLRRSIAAFEAVVDGIVTDQALDEGVSMEFDASRPTAGKDFAFVALDLLSIDNQRLFDVPLLERKRLLDSVITQSPLVRISPYVTPPIQAWLRTWRMSGFRGAIVKAANSRYLPGSRTDQWAIIEKNR
jgi:bifunctional non-homologous end joining protein LigD